MLSYAVADPQIDELLDLETGQHLSAGALIGSGYGCVMQLRMALRCDIASDAPRYGGAQCVPVYLIRIMWLIGRSNPDGAQVFATNSR